VRPAPRRWTIIAAAVLLLTLLIAAGLSWQSSRRTKSPQATAPATDPWEAGLLRAVQAHPTDAHVHEELAAYYGEHQQPFSALWQMAAAQEVGKTAPALSRRMAEALRQSGLPDVALQLLAEDRGAAPTSADLAMAQVHLEMADPAAALAALRRDPAATGSPDGLLLEARALLALDDLTAARDAARRYRS